MRIASSGLVSVDKSAYIKQTALTSSGNAVAWDSTDAANAYHLTTENTTFSAPTNATEGAIISVEIAQGGTPYTVAWQIYLALDTTDQFGKKSVEFKT
jgi:hypothetical protein